MKQTSSLEQEYKDLMQQAAPDLWSRIEGNLSEHPERVLCQDEAEEKSTVPENKGYAYPTIYKWMAFGTAASIAAVFLLIIASPWFPTLFPVRKQMETDMEISGGVEAEAGMAPETTAAVYENTMAAQETAAVNEDSNPASVAPPVSAGVIRYSQLDLADYTSLPLPAQAVTLPEDTLYFSEDILGDTELLCLGTVTSVSLEADSPQQPASLVYDIRLDSVCYSQDYTSDLESVTVKSPVIGAKGGDHQILYQLQAGFSYLLPLKKQADGWELLFPFAPQVQVTGNGSYLFHSGYTSLTDARTFVVIGDSEGANDFYYDRMLLREDEDFLSDFISLIMAYGSKDI
ncbi:MAG: hypothetical protein HFG66_07100 [Hungatella sp.]|nr:hypothetical protein [Hungatella sp.]